MLGRRATSRDVAQLAGVSRTAVSLVLNGRGAGNIAPVKQEAIRQAARSLNYTPNAVALSLRNQRTRTIGVVTDAIATGGYGGSLLQGAAEMAHSTGHLLLVIDTMNDAAREADAYQTLATRHVDGYLFAAMSQRPYDPPAGLDTARAAGTPLVLANCHDPSNRLSSVTADELAGGRAAAQVLLDRGHTRITLLSGTLEVEAARYRLAGYQEAMRAAGLEPSPPVIGGWDIGAGFHAARQALDGPAEERPTALLCANDRAAIGVALAASQLGLSIPADLSIVGYDDDIDAAPCMVPPLTTIALPHRQIGEAAMRMLLDLMPPRSGEDSINAAGEQPQPPRQVHLPCPVVLRDSVGPPRAHA